MNQTKDEPDPAKKPLQIYFCHSCNIQISNRKLFEMHKRQQAHIANEKARVSSNGNNARSSNVSAGIYVRGYPPNTKENDLVKYFSQFGSIIWAHFGHNFLLLDFTDASAVEKTISRNAHFLNGHRLTVHRKESRNIRVPVNDIEENERIYQEIIEALKPLNNFDEEVLCMAQKLQPNPPESFRKYNLVCQDLYTSLSISFPAVWVHPFGSTLTGLGFNNSDIDVFLANIKDSDDKEIDYLKHIKRCLWKSKRFANCFVIPGAKIPLVKCVHVATGIKCDINIKNMLGVLNSKLIHYYLSIDVRVKQALMVLKYWGKCHKITGQNHLLTNYSLAMLYIYFLQQQPYNFPSILSLQRSQHQQYTNTQTFWNGEFVPNYYFSSERMTLVSLLDIIEDFFTFYSKFSFSTVIICPYLGSPLPRSHFAEPELLCPLFSTYKEYMRLAPNASCGLKVDTCLCLQDPFEHTRNVTCGVTESTLETFVALCTLGKSICSSKANVLFNLLTQQPPNAEKQKYQYKDNILIINLRKSSSFAVCPRDIDWYTFVRRFISTALKDFLLLTSTTAENESQDVKKVEETWAGKLNMWHARKATAKQLNLSNANTSLVERETAITNHLKEAYKNFQDTTDILSFKLTMEEKDEEVEIVVEKVTAYKKSFKSFAMFLVANLPVWLDQYEKDLKKRGPDKPS